MGNSALSREFSTRRLSVEEREAMKKFGDEEMQLLKETFKGLANARNGSAVDKETFLKCFPMPGLLGERLFEVIDKDRSDSIGYNEFLHGVAILFRGSRKEKLKFIFDLYDLSRSGSISRHELVTMLHQLPESALELIKPKAEEPRCNNEHSPKNNPIDDIDALVNLAFPGTHAANSRLSFEQFCEWCEATPGITDFLMSVLPSEDQPASQVSPIDGVTVHPVPETMDVRKRRNSLKTLTVTRSCPRMNQMAESSNRRDLERTKQLLQEAKQLCPAEAVGNKIQLALVELDKMLLLTSGSPVHGGGGITGAMGPQKRASASLDPTTVAVGLDDLFCTDDDTMDGNLWKRGSRLRQMIKRHYVLQGNFLYYYATKDDAAPRGVTFMCGCYVESLPQNVIIEKNVKYYAIDIAPEPGSSREKRTIYTKSLEEQAKWTNALRNATDKLSVHEFYDIGPQLGRGRFSKVCEATHKKTGVKHAVKIIDKCKLIATEKELLRTEIAILKLVTHPNIIHLHDVYEDKQYIFIVTELVGGGELFNRIVGRSRYTESEARIVMAPLLESVAYLHRLGIVHRDIKPENILCGEKLNDLKIADFGLSKLVHPEEIMKMPCGTLNYVAPEVLSLVGYGREADIWSVGVIMFLLLRGDLPFHGKTKNEIIQKTLHADVNLEGDVAWHSISPSGKALLKGLLTKDPSKRLTAQDALRQEWFNSRAMMRTDSLPGMSLTPKTSRASMTQDILKSLS